jgi:hypothetical protein
MADLEAQKGSTHAAEAASAFVRAVQEHLPPEAFAELNALDRDAIEQWADRWHVHAPCILELAETWCSGGWGEGFTIDTCGGSSTPADWPARLRELNSRPTDVDGLGRLRSLRGGDHRDLEALRNEVGPVQREIAQLTEAIDAGKLDPQARERLHAAQARRDDLTKAIKKREGERHLEELREKELNVEEALAPISADPSRESEDRFVQRARTHFRARKDDAKRFGYVKVSVKPKLLNEHMDWLVRFQLHGESRAEIARSTNVVRQAVDRAIRDTAALLKLRLRKPIDDFGSDNN